MPFKNVSVCKIISKKNLYKIFAWGGEIKTE